jgi:multidrug efflux pump
MKWVDILIKNKLIIYLISLLICLIGIYCLIIIPVAPFPTFQANSIAIDLSYPGANAQTVEQQLTSKVISGLKSINNIRQITANSEAGEARINLVLDSVNTNDLMQTQIQIMQVISSSNIPSTIPQPKVEINKGTSDLMVFVATSPTASIFSINNFLESTLKPEFSSLSNVIVGMQDSNAVIKIQLNPVAIAAYHLNPVTVSNLINSISQASPLGSLVVQQQRYMLNIGSNLQSLTNFGDIIVGYQYHKARNVGSLIGKAIYLKDIATVSFEPRDIIAPSVIKVDGKTAAALRLYTTGNADPFYIAKKTKTYINQLKITLPDNITITPMFDQSKIIASSITEVIIAIIVACVLVLTIALIFLGRFKTTLIPIVTIPVCLLGSIIFVYALGYTLNFLTLLAMVIAIGLVVDDAIVVVENIMRYLEHGHKKHEAILHGTADISLTIIGITLTLVAVFLPLMFLSTSTAVMFKAFALTLASSVFISGLVALTLTPVMAADLTSDKPLNHYQIRFDNLLARIIYYYHQSLNAAIKHKLFVLPIILILIIISAYFVLALPKRVFPTDPNRYIAINTMGSPGDNIEAIQNELNKFLPFQSNSMVAHYQTAIEKDNINGILQGSLILELKDHYLNKTYSFVEEIDNFIKKHNFPNTYVEAQNVSNWGRGFDISFFIYGMSSIQQTNSAAEKIAKLMKHSGIFSFVNSQIDKPQKQLMFVIDEIKAASLGISKSQINELLATYYGGYTLNNYFNFEGLSIPIVVQLNTLNLKNPLSLQKMLIQSPLNQKYYPMDSFVYLKTISKPLRISSYNGQLAVKINANLNKHYSMSDAINYVNYVLQQYSPFTKFQYTDNAYDYLQNNNQVLLILILGIICVFFLLTTLFKSMIDPLIILLTIPFSLIGGGLSLYLINGSINIYSALGLITLIGLITKHGILIVKFANNELQKNKSVIEAIFASTHYRFRPIMMTTLAMIFGALPLILSTDIYYMARRSLGVTIVGGLIIGTFFSLYVVPLVYYIVKNRVNSNLIYNK